MLKHNLLFRRQIARASMMTWRVQEPYFPPKTTSCDCVTQVQRTWATRYPAAFLLYNNR
jgi:hypothetical protein